MYRDDGVFIYEFPEPLTLYKPSVITDVAPLLADSQGTTPLTIVVNNSIIDSSLRQAPLQCKFNLEFDGTGDSYFTETEVIFSEDSSEIAIIRCLSPEIIEGLQDSHTDVYLSLSEYDGTYLLQN